MVRIGIRYDQGETSSISVNLPVLLGRSDDCTVRLKGWRIAKQHARLSASPAGIMLEDLGSVTGTYLNGQRVVKVGPLSRQDVIHMGAYELTVYEEIVELTTPPQPIDPLLPNESMAEHEADTQHLHQLWSRKLHARLIEALDLRRRDLNQLSDTALRLQARELLEQLVEEARNDIPPSLRFDELIDHVLNEALGLGPLEDLLQDPSISEVMVNAYNEIYIERQGHIERYPLCFSSPQAVVSVIERIVAPIGRRIDESSPMVDARLKDGSRVNAVIPPIALRGACITIRKFPAKRLDIDDLLQVGSLAPCMAAYLKFCVEAKLNIIVSGGTGSGKTTLLNVLSGFIPTHERIITIEDAAELRLNHEHLISLEARPMNVEGKGEILIRDLVKNALRMRPDRIVVGECRGAEALDMLQAMNTGHEGSLTSLHANTPRDALARLETMILMAGMDLPFIAIREQIASAADVIVQQSRLTTGQRLITSIVEVTGSESGKIQLQELFKYEAQQHRFVGMGLIPQHTLKHSTQAMDPLWFQQSHSAERHSIHGVL